MKAIIADDRMQSTIIGGQIQSKFNKGIIADSKVQSTIIGGRIQEAQIECKKLRSVDKI